MLIRPWSFWWSPLQDTTTTMSLEFCVWSQKFCDVEFMKWTLHFTAAVLLRSFQKFYTRCYGIFFICTCVRHFNQPLYYNTMEPIAITVNMHELDQVISLQAHFPSINNLITNCKFADKWKPHTTVALSLAPPLLVTFEQVGVILSDSNQPTFLRHHPLSYC